MKHFKVLGGIELTKGTFQNYRGQGLIWSGLKPPSLFNATLLLYHIAGYLHKELIFAGPNYLMKIDSYKNFWNKHAHVLHRKKAITSNVAVSLRHDHTIDKN